MKITSAGLTGVAVFVIAAILATVLGARMPSDQADIRGWEAYRIALALSSGQGFSFPTDNRWLFDEEDHASLAVTGDYTPTAWVDPVYTYLLAALMVGAGDSHRYIGGLLNVILFVVIVWLTYLVGLRLNGPPAGAISASIVAWIFFRHYQDWFAYLNNTMLAATFVLLFVIALLRFTKQPGPRNSVVLGVATGAVLVVCPGATALVPIAIFMAWLAERSEWRRSIRNVVLVVVSATAVLAPWAIRNYLVFDEIVLVRTGSGQIAFVGVVSLGGTVAPDTLADGVETPWHADTAREAVKTARGREGRRALEAAQLPYAREIAGEHFAHMNEAQRDKWFAAQASEYLVDNLAVSMELAVWKLREFVMLTRKPGAALLVLALVGGIIGLARRRLELVALALCVGGFVAPFALVIPYFLRYRLPIEPIVVIAAVAALFELMRMIKSPRRAANSPR